MSMGLTIFIVKTFSFLSFQHHDSWPINSRRVETIVSDTKDFYWQWGKVGIFPRDLQEIIMQLYSSLPDSEVMATV